MPQRWELGQILSLPLRRKACGGLRPSLNPRTRVPEAGMLTTRPSKPSISSLNFPLFLSYFNYIRIFQTTVFREREKKCSNIKFHENPSSGSRVVPCGLTDGRADMTALIVAAHSFAKARKKISSSVSVCTVRRKVR